MDSPRLFRRWWLVPVGIGLLGVALSCLAFLFADRADDRRVQGLLQSRAEWRARDIEAKIRLSGNAVENVAIAISANPFLDPESFRRLALRARRAIDHVNALQWAPRIRQDQLAGFEQSARYYGINDYRVFDVTPDFRPTELAARDEYFPVLFDVRFEGGRLTQGLALGKYDGRRIPMERARDTAGPIATLPVQPIGPPSSRRVYLLFWPVYDGVDLPTIEERHAKLRGYAVGNYDIESLLFAAVRNTPEIIETIRFFVTAAHVDGAPADAVAVYSPVSRRIEPGTVAIDPSQVPAARVERHFDVFGQHWHLAFEYAPAALAARRSNAAWGWLVAGLLLTSSLVFYLWRARGRTERIAAMVTERTAELERTSAQLQQAQKMEAIGNLTGGMAHDFNNLLSVVIGNLDLLEEKTRNDPETAALVEAALQAGLRGAELTRRLLAFARRQPLAPRITDLNELVTGMIRLLERMLEGHIEIRLKTAPGLWPVMIDPAQLNSAIVNLATNARDAMPDGGRLTIETKNTHLDADYAALNPGAVPGDYVLLEVSDTGRGMPAETLAQVFEPFFTTKDVGQGTGLGLSMVFGFVKQSEGHIKIYSEVGQGTTVRLYFPRGAHETQATTVASAALKPPEKGNETVLVVEDDAAVRATVVRQLTELGYTVLEVENGNAALLLLKNPESRIDLLFTDLVMPGGMSGRDLARAARVERPSLRVLFASGYPGTALHDGDRLPEQEHFLSKPYRKQDLARKIQDVLKT